MLHTEEMEILLPEKINESEEVPLLLGVGPSLTMAVPIILMAVLSKRIYGNGSNFMIMSLITGVSTCIFGLIWGISNRVYKRKSIRLKKEKCFKEYIDYLEDTRRLLTGYVKDNREHMLLSYPSAFEVICEGKGDKRFPLREDYLYLRLGLGSCPFQVKLKAADGRKEIVPSREVLLRDELIGEFKELPDVPSLVDLSVTKALAVVGDKESERTYLYMLGLILTLAAFLDPGNVRFCIIYNEEDQNMRALGECVKFLPHLFDPAGHVRLLLGALADAPVVLPCALSYLEDKDKHIIFFILDSSLLKGEVLGEKLCKENVLEAVNIISLWGDISDIPVTHSSVIVLPEEGSSIGTRFENGNKRDPVGVIKTDGFGIPPKDVYRLTDKYIRDSFREYYRAMVDDGAIPERVSFASLYDVLDIKDINVAKNWGRNRTEERIRVPIGMSEKNEKLYLDINERFHGPHGLIAGTTGSGKSELIETYILSLCTSFSPREINFFIIDYKGGGTGNYIRDLPHCAGSISNLSGKSIERALKAIVAEVYSRQKILSEYGVNHIDGYMKLIRKGKGGEFFPHLLIIIDEFAELKKEEPDFMKQIISLAAVGRSLGIHLILSTQKPAGVVDDKIWSNSRFRLCLKVQDRQDSMDMLHKPDASMLTRPGQCYLEIGNDEYFKCFQTAYCGEAYNPYEGAVNDVLLVTRSGERIKSDNDVINNSEITVLRKMIERINDEADVLGIGHAKTLWIDELPTVIEDAPEATDFSIGIPIGIFDDPAGRRQGKIYYEPLRHGHLLIAGAPGSGKSNLIHLFISKIKEDDYIFIDSARLGTLNIPVLFYHLKKLFKKRDKKLFIFIDNFALFFKGLNEKEAETFARYLSEGPSQNIFFVISVGLLSEIPGKLFLKMKTSLSFEMNDRFQYGEIMRKYHLDTFPSSGIPGRCLYKVNDDILECQIFKASENELKDQKLSLEEIPFIPLKADALKMFKDYVSSEYFEENVIPLGFSLTSGYIRGITVRERGVFLIEGSEENGVRGMIKAIREYLEKYNPSLSKKVMVFDDIDAFNGFNEACEASNNEDCRGEAGFSILVLDPNEDRIKTLKAEQGFSKMTIEGLNMAGMTLKERMLDFGDLTYSEQNAALPYGYGYMRSLRNSRTLKLKLAFLTERETEDDYD